MIEQRAKEAYSIWESHCGWNVPWERLKDREREAWCKVVEHFDAEAADEWHLNIADAMNAFEALKDNVETIQAAFARYEANEPPPDNDPTSIRIECQKHRIGVTPASPVTQSQTEPSRRATEEPKRDAGRGSSSKAADGDGGAQG